MDIGAASTWGNAVISYDKAKLEKAAELLLKDYDKLKDSDTYEVSNHLECYSDFLVSLGYTKDEAFQLIFMIIELVSTLCYSSIVLKQPDDIDHVKPLLYDTIRKMIQR